MGTKKEEIQNHFSVHGTITKIVFNDDEKDENWRSYAFITYKNETSASAACKQRFQRLHGKKVKVEIAVSKNESTKITENPYLPMQQFHSLPTPEFLLSTNGQVSHQHLISKLTAR